jgi:hypothetical protein
MTPEAEGCIFIAEEFAEFIALDTLTRPDCLRIKQKLAVSGLDPIAQGAMYDLIRLARAERQNAAARAREECHKQWVVDTIAIMEATKAPSVTIDASAEATSTASSRSHSEAVGKKVMGDDIKIGGNVTNAAVGSSSKFQARDVTAYNNAVDNSSIDDEITDVLKRAREALDAEGLSEGDAEDASDSLAKLSAELEKPQKDVGRIRRLWNGIKEIAPTVAAILSSAASLDKLFRGMP